MSWYSQSPFLAKKTGLDFLIYACYRNLIVKTTEFQFTRIYKNLWVPDIKDTKFYLWQLTGTHGTHGTHANGNLGLVSKLDILSSQVHRKGSTRAFPPHHPLIPVDYQLTGQPVLIGGTMGSCSYVLTGTERGMEQTFG